MRMNHTPMSRAMVLPALAALALLACTEARTQTPADAAPEMNSWVAAHNRGDLDALVEHYAADAVLLPPNGSVIRGHDAVRSTFERTVASEGVRLVRVGSWADAHVATEVGTWEHFTRDTGASTSAGTYSVTWRRDEGGAWRIVMNGYAVRADAPKQEAAQ